MDKSTSNFFKQHSIIQWTGLGGVELIWDDATMWQMWENTGIDSDIQVAADQATLWTDKNMITNIDKTKEMVIYFGQNELTLSHLNI